MVPCTWYPALCTALGTDIKVCSQHTILSLPTYLLKRKQQYLYPNGNLCFLTRSRVLGMETTHFVLHQNHQHRIVFYEYGFADKGPWCLAYRAFSTPAFEHTVFSTPGFSTPIFWHTCSLASIFFQQTELSDTSVSKYIRTPADTCLNLVGPVF